jgi:sporulation protein YlmC with PRC-barrel domain
VKAGDDPGRPIAYEVLAPGTPVCDREGRRVGTVKKVLADEQEDIFDGIVIETQHGTRFIDAPDVTHIAERRVDLKLMSAEVASQPEHEEPAPTYHLDAPRGRGQDLWRRIGLHRLWRRD